jgi:hypothetical protein
LSTKMSIPTHRIFTTKFVEGVEGPVVSPDKARFAKNLSEVHDILKSEGAVLIYSKEWIYLPRHAIDCILRGTSRFKLPWPLVGDEETE